MGNLAVLFGGMTCTQPQVHPFRASAADSLTHACEPSNVQVEIPADVLQLLYTPKDNLFWAWQHHCESKHAALPQAEHQANLDLGLYML